MNLLNRLLYVLALVFLFWLFSPTQTYAESHVLHGTVKTTSGTGISEAIVTINNSEATSSTTDENGSYTITVTEGTYDVQVTPPSNSGFSSALALGQTISADTILNFVLTQAGISTLNGRVKDRYGNGVQGQAVTLFNSAGTQAGQSITNASGDYSITVSSGVYRLTVAANNNSLSLNVPQAYTLVSNDLSLMQNISLNIDLPIKQVTLQIRNKDGEKLNNIQLTSSSGGDASNLSIGGGITNGTGRSDYGINGIGPVSDINGEITLWLYSNNETNPYTLNFTPPSGSNYIFTSVSNLNIADDATIPIEIKSSVTFSGTLTDREGVGLAGQFISLYNSSGVRAGQVITSTSGSYSIKVAPGIYRLQIEANNNNLSLTAPQTYNLTSNNLDLTQDKSLTIMLPLKQVTLHIQDQDGTPLSGMQLTSSIGGNTNELTLANELTNATGRSSYGVNGIGPISNSSGNIVLWLFVNNPNMPYTFNITPPVGSNYVLTSSANNNIAEDATITVNMQSAVILSGIVKDRFGDPVPGQFVSLRSIQGVNAGQSRTNASGSYSIKVAKGVYTILVEASNNNLALNVPQAYILTANDVSLTDNTPLDITLPVKQVTVHIQNENGVALSNIQLTSSAGGNASNLSLAENINNVTGRSYYGINGIGPKTDSYGNMKLWLFVNNTSAPYTLNFTPPTGSIYKIFTLENHNVIDDQTEIIQLQYNHAAPVTAVGLETQYQDGTYSDPTLVTLSAEAASGYTIAHTYYKVDGGVQQTYSGAFEVSGIAPHTIEYWSVDNSGVIETHKTKNFTILPQYTLTGNVYVDANSNGFQDEGENGYEGAVVTLDNNQTVTTDNNGGYSFTNLPAGTYIETLTAPAGYIVTTTNPATIALGANSTLNFGIAATPTPTPSGNPKFTASNVVISSSHISFDISNIDPNYTDTHNTFFAIEIRKPDYSQRYFYAAALPENGYVPNALSRQASCNALLRCDVAMTSDNNGTPTDYIIQISSDTLNHGNDALESQVLTWPTPTVVSSINTGGSTEGNYVADTNYAGGSVYTSSTAVDTSGVTNPAPEGVYQSVRYGNFSYTIPNLTPNASYSLRLHFNELYWNNAGARVFNVSANGQQVLANYDIFQAAGAKNKAVVAQVPATADTNGEVTLQFNTVTDNAMVNGIDVYSGELPSPTPTATPTPPNPLNVNAGGATVESYSADNGFTGGSVYTTATSVSTNGVTNPAPDAVYQSVRYGAFSYAIANLTPNTNYLVRLHFNELYWNSAGQRVFNVSVNGNQVLGNYDIYQEAGGAHTAVVEEFVKKADASGTITIAFTNVVDNAMVSGIELQDASAVQTYSLSGAIYNDANENGFQDSGEEGVSDVTVSIPTEGSTTTDSNGNYTFSNLVAGVYTTQVTVPNGYATTTQNPVTVAVTANTTQNFGVKQVNYAVDAGGNGASAFLADQNYTGGSVYTTTTSVDTTGVTNPAPEVVYQTVRYGNFSYTIPNLTPNSTHTIRLHFNELYWQTEGSRVFTISVNGTQVIENYDIYQAAGGANKAVVEDVQGTADANGNFTIQFNSVTDNAMVNGIELLN